VTKEDMMKAFVAYNKSGRVTGVGIPNPEFGDEIGMEPTNGDSILTIDAAEVVKDAERLSFTGSGESRDELQEVVRSIVERYRVDPSSRRLVSNDESK
jgi:hypothetical protein